MCGIFGYQIVPGYLSTGRKMMLGASLATFNDARGGHSWGMVKLEENDELTIYRGLGEFLDNIDKLGAPDTFFGHTRYATVGSRTVENAHPFEIGKIVGAHNGGVFNHDEMDKKYNRKFAVDSMHIFAHIAENRKSWDLEGYGTIEYLDRDDPSRIYLCRFRGGDLAVAGLGKLTKKRNTIMGVVWSSSDKHLETALWRAGIESHDYFMFNDVHIGQLYEVRGADLLRTDQRFYLLPPLVDPRWKEWQKMPNGQYTKASSGFCSPSSSSSSSSFKDYRSYYDHDDWKDEKTPSKDVLAKIISEDRKQEKKAWETVMSFPGGGEEVEEEEDKEMAETEEGCDLLMTGR